MNLLMRVLMLGVGASLAGLYFALQSGLPWLRARRTGVIRRLGPAAQKVERVVDPQRFKALSDRRLKTAATGLLISIGGLAAICFSVTLLCLAP